MTGTPLELFLSKLTDAKKNGKGWSARCPAHEDRRPSLSVSEGADGRALVRCHAGCTVDAICDAVGLRVVDLMPDHSSATSTSTQPRQSRRKWQNRRQHDDRPAETYETAKAAIEALERKHGKRSDLWTYHDANGDPVGAIVRWDRAGGKDIRPVARCGDRWTIGGMPEPRPLYCLPDLAGADRIFITEGEKAADAVRAIGLTATTSAHGSQSPGKTDWSPVAGKECVKLPDNDDSGIGYASTVQTIIGTLSPTTVFKVVHLPDLPDKGDMADFVAMRRAAGKTNAEIRAEVEALADGAEAIQPDRPTARIERFQPFPTDALPDPIRGYVEAGAKAIGCDSSYVAVPLLCGLSGAIGATRRIGISATWRESCILWGAIVGESGTQKTPAQEG